MHWTECHAFTHDSEVNADPPVPDHSRTINKKIPIVKDATGCPVLPCITPEHNFKTKMVQSMLREYCTAHISKHSIIHSVIIINSIAQDSHLESKQEEFHGQNWSPIQLYGSSKTAFQRGMHGMTHPRFRLMRCSAYWITGGPKKTPALIPSFGHQPAHCSKTQRILLRLCRQAGKHRYCNQLTLMRKYLFFQIARNLTLIAMGVTMIIWTTLPNPRMRPQMSVLYLRTLRTTMMKCTIPITAHLVSHIISFCACILFQQCHHSSITGLEYQYLYFT
jgi:hypothetical protein